MFNFPKLLEKAVGFCDQSLALYMCVSVFHICRGRTLFMLQCPLSWFFHIHIPQTPLPKCSIFLIPQHKRSLILILTIKIAKLFQTNLLFHRTQTDQQNFCNKCTSFSFLSFWHCQFLNPHWEELFSQSILIAFVKLGESPPILLLLFNFWKKGKGDLRERQVNFGPHV